MAPSLRRGSWTSSSQLQGKSLPRPPGKEEEGRHWSPFILLPPFSFCCVPAIFLPLLPFRCMALHLVGMMAFSELYSKQPSRRLPEGIDILLASLMVSQCVCGWMWVCGWVGGYRGKGARDGLFRDTGLISVFVTMGTRYDFMSIEVGLGQCSPSPWQHSYQPQHRSGCGSVGGSGGQTGGASIRVGQPLPRGRSCSYTLLDWRLSWGLYCLCSSVAERGCGILYYGLSLFQSLFTRHMLALAAVAGCSCCTLHVLVALT